MNEPANVYANAAAIQTSKYDHTLLFGRIEEGGNAAVNVKVTLPAEFFNEFVNMVLESQAAARVQRAAEAEQGLPEEVAEEG